MFPKNLGSVLEAERLGLLPDLLKVLWEDTLSEAGPTWERKEELWLCLQGLSIAFSHIEMSLNYVIVVITLLPNEIAS